MDEAKKRELEELRKQLDPKVLEKMAGYLTGDGDDGGASGHTDDFRSRKADKFQERVLQRKKQMQMAEEEKPAQPPQPERVVFIYSTQDIWTRIIESQFKSFGFQTVEICQDFPSVIRGVHECGNRKDKADIVIAVALNNVPQFVQNFETLRLQSQTPKEKEFLDAIPFFFMVESYKQLQETLLQHYGYKHILQLTDSTQRNQDKVTELFYQLQHQQPEEINHNQPPLK